MKKKEVKQWIEAIETTIKEYESGSHDSNDCALCKVVNDDCSKCILQLESLHCTNMVSYKRASGFMGRFGMRVRFHHILKSRLENRPHETTTLQNIKNLAWKIELSLLEGHMIDY